MSSLWHDTEYSLSILKGCPSVRTKDSQGGFSFWGKQGTGDPCKHGTQASKVSGLLSCSWGHLLLLVPALMCCDAPGGQDHTRFAHSCWTSPTQSPMWTLPVTHRWCKGHCQGTHYAYYFSFLLLHTFSPVIYLSGFYSSLFYNWAPHCTKKNPLFYVYRMLIDVIPPCSGVIF